MLRIVWTNPLLSFPPEVHSGRFPRRGGLDQYPLYFIERSLILPPVVELGRVLWSAALFWLLISRSAPLERAFHEIVNP